MRSTAADEREMRLDPELQALAAAKDWDGVLAALDQYDKNNNRRHKAHRDDMDVTVVDREPDDAGEFRYPAASLLKLSSPADWLDIIYSQRPEDLHQLVTDDSISEALKGLTQKQKTVLLEHIVWGRSTREIAEEMRCSVRNIVKHRQAALDRVLRAIKE